MVVNGVEGKRYDGIGGMLFSPDSKRLAYVAIRGTKSLVVIDGMENKEYDAVDLLVFSLYAT